MPNKPIIDPYIFQQQLAAFQKFIEDKSDVELTSFSSHPYIDDQEGYKYRVHSAGRKALNLMSWSQAEIGTGRICDAVIAAIEQPGNNLVSWRARYGEDSKAHRPLLEAKTDAELCRRVEDCLFRLYLREQDPEVFAELVDILGKRYSLIAFLFYLKDRSRYLPIAPEYFDSAFELLGVLIKTSGKCSWQNYSAYLDLLGQVRALLTEYIDADVTLLDAHSFCWMLVAQMSKEVAGANIPPHSSALSAEPTQKGTKIVYFNNCLNREHARLFGERAFFDLDTVGRQAGQARDLPRGQICVVVGRGSEGMLNFNWYSLDAERLVKDRESPPELELKRVFDGQLLYTQALAKAQAAADPRYVAFFRSNGYLKIGSVFVATLLPENLPPELTRQENNEKPGGYGAGFGDAIQNKKVEMAAMTFVTAHYRADGWEVEDVTQPPCGYDLQCTRGSETRNVEVKGISGQEQSFIITANEVEHARTNGNFVLAVVTSALSEAHKLTQYSGAEFIERFDLGAIQYSARPKR